MITQFYGVIKANGQRDPACASSGNFQVSRTGPGQYTVTLGQWIAAQNRPLVVVAPDYGTDDIEVRCTNIAHDAVKNRWSLEVRTKVAGGNNHSDQRFVLNVQCGNDHFESVSDVRSPPSDDIVLTAEVIAFDNGQATVDVLALSTTVVDPAGNQTTIVFDTATRLELVGERLSIELGTLAGYTLTGYLYGPGTQNPTIWANNGTTLDLALAGNAPETSQQRIVVTATNSSGAYLSSDPVIRLSKTPPGGVLVS